MSAEDMPRDQATETFIELTKQVGRLPNPTPEERDARERAREEASERLIREARLAEYRNRWEEHCPSDLKESDWSHARMKPWATQINLVLSHQLGSPKGLLLFGPSGRGKSRSMWQLMRRLCCDEGRDVKLWTAAKWFSELQRQVKFGHDDALGWVETVARRPLVFIDDFGQEALLASRAEWSMGWFFQFLDIRVGERLPLFITTNLTSKQLAARGDLRGDPLVRRLLDVCEIVTFEK